MTFLCLNVLVGCTPLFVFTFSHVFKRNLKNLLKIKMSFDLMLLSYRHEQVDSFLLFMKFSVSLCEACKCSCFSSFVTTFPANTLFTQLTCWFPNEEACEWASSQVKNNLWITLPSVHSRSSLLPWSLFYCDICICQLLLVKVVYSETTCSSWRETKRDNSCSQCGNSESREGSSLV